MAGIGFKFENGDKLGQTLKLRSQKFTEKQRKAIVAAATRAKTEIETRGRADIRAGGNFGSERWQQGFQAKLSYTSVGNAVIRVTHSVKYWKVFEFGARIMGKPMLWIPLAFATAAKLKVRARDYPGRLFRVDRKGKAPLLLDKTGPQYFGKQSVTIPKKFHLRQVVREVSRNMRQYYNEAMRNGR